MLVVDHVVPVASGGDNAVDNLVTACFDCNAGKGARHLGNTMPPVDSDAVLQAAQDLAEQRAALGRYYAEQQALQREIDEVLEEAEAAWITLVSTCDQSTEEGRRWAESARDRFERRSAIGWQRRGFGVADFRWAALQTASEWSRRGEMSVEHLWRFYCKTCWDAIRASGVDW